MVLSVMKMERLSGITLLEADGANQSEEGAKMNNEFLPAYKAVSYTHLDVYKRQHQPQGVGLHSG